MNEMTITINKQEIPIKEYNGQRVVTFKEIDAVHERADGTARKRFNDNRKRFIEGVDYFVRNSDEAAKEFGVIAPNGLVLMTESGYLMLVKSFTDDLAWKVQRELVNSYFKLRETMPDLTESTAAPMRLLTVDDYLNAARTIAMCQKSRLNLVVAILSKAGITDRDELERTMRENIGTSDVVERLQETLDATGMSKAQLANKLGISTEVLRSYLTGRRFPRPDRYNAMVTVLDRLGAAYE